MARLHIYPHSEPKQDLHIVGDPAALRDLANALLKVAQSPHVFNRVQLHTSDGHEYTAMIVSGVSEEEWQTVPPAYQNSTVPAITVLDDYHTMRRELASMKEKV
jgi:hypothetical protein